jgi:hypothetical protein
MIFNASFSLNVIKNGGKKLATFLSGARGEDNSLQKIKLFVAIRLGTLRLRRIEAARANSLSHH